MKTYCSAAAKRSPQQGELPAGFWSDVEFKTGNGKNGRKFAQCQIYSSHHLCSVTDILNVVTGCIRPDSLDRLNPSDNGGQYDSSGGAHGQGNPVGSICVGLVFSYERSNGKPNRCIGRYNHYVELVEPAGPRACIKCCDDPADCPSNKGKYISATIVFWLYFNAFSSDKEGCPNVITGNYFNCGG